MSSAVGTLERRASERRAALRPFCDKIAGWMPREISRSSSRMLMSSSFACDIRRQQGRTLGRACIVDRPHLEGQGHERLLDVALPIVLPDANVDTISQLT
jgi:hypothetical protein